jgi:hypothetical protein
MMNVKELVMALSAYPDDMKVSMTLDYGSGLLERGVSNLVSTDEWDEQREPPVVLLIEEDSCASDH